MEHGTSTSGLWRFGLNGEQVPRDHRWAVYETNRAQAPDRWDRICYSARTRAECEAWHVTHPPPPAFTYRVERV